MTDDLDFQVPDVVGYVTAWRAWKVDDLTSAGPGAVTLRSMNGVTWSSRELTAQCSAGCAPALIPHEEHTCGIYAAKTRQHLRDMGYNNYSEAIIVAIGEVLLWGKVIVGTQGWRAQHARIHRLWLPYEHARFVRPIRDRYGVKVGLAHTYGKEV